jgi:hypothetical protein
MIAVPAPDDVTTPVLLIVATDAVLMLHTPPGTVLNMFDVPPAHNVVMPERKPAKGTFTVMLRVVVALPQPVVVV